jgi:hypothetical protein
MACPRADKADSRLGQARPQPVGPRVDFTARAPCRGGAGRRAGNLPACKGSVDLCLSAARSRQSSRVLPPSTGGAPVPEGQHAAPACLPRHGDSGIAAGCPGGRFRNAGVRRPALVGQTIEVCLPFGQEGHPRNGRRASTKQRAGPACRPPFRPHHLRRGPPVKQKDSRIEPRPTTAGSATDANRAQEGCQSDKEGKGDKKAWRQADWAGNNRPAVG